MGRLSNAVKAMLPPPPGPEERYRRDVINSVNRQVALLIKYGLTIEEVQQIRSGNDDLIKTLAYNLRDRSYKGRRLGKQDVEPIAQDMVKELRYLDTLKEHIDCPCVAA